MGTPGTNVADESRNFQLPCPTEPLIMATPACDTPFDEKASSPSSTTDNNNNNNNPSQHPPKPIRTRKVKNLRWFFTCVGVLTANFLYGLDNTIVAVIQPDISEAFNNNVYQLGWLGVGFCLGATAMILPLGRAYGVFDDAKKVYLSCLTMFAAGSALCGAAPSMTAMIIARVWAGAGGAGMYLGTLNLFTSLCLPEEQPMFMGLVALIYGVGCIAGPVVGGALADSAAGWRWAFYLNLVVIGAQSPIFLWCIPSMSATNDRRRMSENFKNFDCVGILLSFGTYVTFALGLSMAGNLWPWSDARTIAVLVLCGILAVATILSQYRPVLVDSQHRIFPVAWVTDPVMVAMYVMTAAIGSAQFVAIYYIPLYFSFVHGDSGIQAAVRLLPFVLCYIGSVMVCSVLMRKTGHPMLWYLSSGLATTVGGALWYSVKQDSPVSETYGFSVILGLGMVAAQACYAIGPNLVRGDAAPSMIQFFNAGQGQGYLLGLCIASITFQSFSFQGLETILKRLGYSDVEIHSAVAGTRSKVLMDIDNLSRRQSIDAIVGSISRVWIMVIAGGATVTLASCSVLVLRRRSLKTLT